MDRRQLLVRAGATAALPFLMTGSAGAVESDAFPAFSDAEMAARLQRTQKAMAAKGLDALLLYGHSAIGSSVGQVNLQYLARYAAVIETWLVVPVSGEPTMLLGVPYHIPNARALSSVKDIRPGDSLGNAIGRIKELKLEAGHIGLVGPGLVTPGGPTMFHEQYVRLTTALPNVKFESATAMLDELRLEKSDEEIALLRRAGMMTDMVAEELFKRTRAGVTPLALRRAIDGLTAEAGATMPFGHIGAITMADPAGYYPDFYPTDVPITAGQMVMTELAAGYGNYWAKLWGSFFVGEPDADYRRMFDVASEVHAHLQKGLKPGMTGRDVNAFLAPIAKARLEQPANVLVGGWSSLNTPPQMGAAASSLSAPFAAAYLDKVLKPRQSVTLQAWVCIPGTKKGLWVGSSGIITENGYESFNRYPIGTVRVAPGGAAAAAAPEKIRGKLTAISATRVAVTGFDGRKWDMALAPEWSVQVMHPITLGEIKPGRFVGVIAKQEAGGERVYEVHMFLPSVKMGAGTIPWDRPAGSTVSSGEVVSVGSDGTLVLKVDGKDRAFKVRKDSAIVLVNNETHDRIKPGIEVFILGWPQPGGGLRVDAIATGPNGGSVPL